MLNQSLAFIKTVIHTQNKGSFYEYENCAISRKITKAMLPVRVVRHTVQQPFYDDPYHTKKNIIK